MEPTSPPVYPVDNDNRDDGDSYVDDSDVNDSDDDSDDDDEQRNGPKQTTVVEQHVPTVVKQTILNPEEAKEDVLRREAALFISKKQGQLLHGIHYADSGPNARERHPAQQSAFETLASVCPTDNEIKDGGDVQVIVVGRKSSGKTEVIKSLLGLQSNEKLNVGRDETTTQTSHAAGVIKIMGEDPRYRLVLMDTLASDTLVGKNVTDAIEAVYNSDIVVCLYVGSPVEVRVYSILAEMMQKQVFYVQTKLDTDFQMQDEDEDPETFAKLALHVLRIYAENSLNNLQMSSITVSSVHDSTKPHQHTLEWFGISCRHKFKRYFELEKMKTKLISEAERLIHDRNTKA
eukprot:m.8425 g.8425  ORF g.8425 m.8425 type:complete len:346 (+) comp3118_c0_seq1:300-1337(+)